MKTFLTLVLLAFRLSSFATVPPLEREVSLDLNHEKITVAFEKMHDLVQVNFSYAAALIATLEPVSISLQNKTVREALALLLPSHILVKQKNNYIILVAKPIEKIPAKKQISGYVYDQVTEKKVPNATVYDKSTLQSVTTNEYGYYELTVPVQTETISVNKQEYRDTTAIVQKIEEHTMVNFTIQPVSYLQRLKDSLQIKERLSEIGDLGRKAFQNFQSYVNVLNVRDTIQRNFQVSFLPFIGTNHRLSGNVYNHVSLNILGGFARGLDGFEAAGIFNVDRENVSGFQAAGLFNVVGDSMRGAQVAGLMNITGKYSAGMQAAGLINICGGTQEGVQAAGLMNITKKQIGIGAAGYFNISGSLKGVYAAGLANISDSLEGVEAAGLFNICGHGKNVTQVSSFFNTNLKGSSVLQVSTFFNKTSYLKGTQIAFFNVADSAVGVPLGLLSVVKKGLHQIEFSADEWFPANVSFRSGVPAFYNIISAGLRAGNKGSIWQLGYGIGSSVKLSKQWSFDGNVNVAHISQGTFYWAASELYRLYIGVEYRPYKKLGIAFGPDLNFYITDALRAEYETKYRAIAPTSLWNSTSRFGFNRTVWVGARLALRLF